MTPAEYRTALATLGLSQLAAGRWLGVSNKTAQRYATTGPSGAAARAVGLAVALNEFKVGGSGNLYTNIRHSDLTAAHIVQK